MRRLLPRTFLAQLVWGIVVVQTVFLAVFIVGVVIRQRRVAHRETHDRIAAQLNMIAAACAKQLHDEDLESLHNVLDLASIAQSIQSTRLTDLDGKTLATSSAARRPGLDAYEQKVLPKALQQQIFPIANGQYEAVTPVFLDGKPLALLWLEPNPAISLSTARTVVRISFTYGVIALLVNFVPIFLLVRSMTRPLKRLTDATRSLGKTSGAPVEFPLPVTSSNEAGELTASFNRMMGELQEQRAGLVEALALLDSLLDHAPIGFAFCGRNLRLVQVNHVLAEMHARPVEELLGRSVEELFSPPAAERVGACILRVFESGEELRDVEFSTDLPAEAGANRTWLCQFYPVRTAKDPVRWVGCIVVEITERLRAEQTLRRTEKLAAAGRLAASVAHEVNNPLESVTNLLYILEQHGTLDDAALAYIHIAQAELARVSHITQQTLRFYRESVSRKVADLADVLDSIVLLYKPKLTAGRIAVERDYRGDTSLMCFGGELRQTFANLIVNAVDAMPHGGTLRLRTRRVTVRGEDAASQRGIAVCVADNGIGMSRQTQARIFEAFFTTKEATGTGLGLWVTEEIVRKHCGTLRVRSRPGAGTCFRIFLPELSEAEKNTTSPEVKTT